MVLVVLRPISDFLGACGVCPDPDATHCVLYVQNCATDGSSATFLPRSVLILESGFLSHKSCISSGLNFPACGRSVLEYGGSSAGCGRPQRAHADANVQP